MSNKQRIIGKHALILIARGEKEIASQVFVYDQIREIRVDLEKVEVKVLLAGEEHYQRVFSVTVTKDLPAEKARSLVLNFYNNLLNASMKLSPEEIDNIKKQREANITRAAEINEENE